MFEGIMVVIGILILIGGVYAVADTGRSKEEKKQFGVLAAILAVITLLFWAFSD